MHKKLSAVKTNANDGSFSINKTNPGRKLTQGEISLAKKIFGSSINYEKIVIHTERFLGFQPNDVAMTPFGEIYYPDRKITDFSLADIGNRKLFIHEMSHVWQHQNGKFVIEAGAILCCGTGVSDLIQTHTEGTILSKAGDFISRKINPYIYTLEPGKKLDEYNLESQAEIIADYYCTHILNRPAYKRLNAPNNKVKNLYLETLSDFFRANNKHP